MGKVEVFSIPGLDMWFWSADHIPPHFHAKRAGEWEIRVHILDTRVSQLSYELKWGAGPNRKLQGMLATLVVTHGEALYDEWCHKTGVEG